MTRLEELKKAHIDAGFYKGTPKEVMTLQEVSALSREERFEICYRHWVYDFDVQNVPFEEYKEMTTAEFQDAKSWGGYDEDYEFEEYLIDLAYSYINEIHGTPLSRV